MIEKIVRETMIPTLGSKTRATAHAEAIKRVLALHVLMPTIVEVDTIRHAGFVTSDGWSTMAWIKGFEVARVYSIDKDPRAIEISTKIVEDYRVEHPKPNVHVQWVCADGEQGIAELASSRGDPIHLLYLDGGGSQDEAWAQFCAAQPILHEGSIILMDDTEFRTSPPFEGKSSRVLTYLRSQGMPAEHWGGIQKRISMVTYTRRDILSCK